MGLKYKDTFWLSLHYPEVFFVHHSLFMLKRMFFRYLMPIASHLFPTKNASALKRQSIENRKYIATHVKSAYEKVKVYVVSNTYLCDQLVEKRMLGENSVKFIGLDCEWQSNRKNGVALIQISSGNDCILYRLFDTHGTIPENLRTLLEDRRILKFGVAIQEDVRRLCSHGVQVKGFVDLRNLAQRCLPAREEHVINDAEEDMFQWTSLRSLSFNVLNIRLNKNPHIRCGYWEAPILTKQQILYAAKDAIVSLEIFYALILLRKVNRQSLSVLTDSFETQLETVISWVHEKNWNSSLLNLFCYCHKSDQLTDLNVTLPSFFVSTKPSKWLVELANSLCQGIVDVNHNYRPPVNTRGNSNVPSASSSRGMSTKAGKQSVYKHQCRGKPLYENCYLLGPDKRVLATVNKSKAQWYVHKELGEIECESPFSVRLLFEPSGRPTPDADYYTTVKENVCVVCGSKESFVRKMIIPHDYRKYFPIEFKDHMSHDVLLMCLGCHMIAQRSDEMLRQELAVKYNAPLGTKDRMMFIDNPQSCKVKSAAKALLHGNMKIPEARRHELEGIVQKYYNVDTVDDDLLRKAVEINIKMENQNFRGFHGERVVRSVLSHNELPDFVRMWRQRFLDEMEPKYLPPMWSTEHNLYKIKPLVIKKAVEGTVLN